MGLFEGLLRLHEAERHGAIGAVIAGVRRGRRDRFIDSDGFLPLRQAATVMGLKESETVELAGQDMLEWRLRGERLYVRPAVVSVLRVREVS